MNEVYLADTDEFQALVTDVAATTCALNETIQVTPENLWPGQYYWHMFEGFPGWWTFCGEAGAVFHREYMAYYRKLQPNESIAWIETVDSFAERVIDYIRDNEWFKPSETRMIQMVFDACEAYKYKTEEIEE